MASNSMNNKWLRPVLALCALAGLLALGGCGGGSGAPNNPFAVGAGPLSILPSAAVVFSRTPTTLQVTGGSPPYQAFSSNSGVLPVAQNVDGGAIVLLPGDVLADTAVTITVRDALGNSVIASLTVSPAPLFNTLTVVPGRTECGTNAVCSGDTATATVRVTGVGGAGIPNRLVRFDVVSGPFAIESGNPAQPLVTTLTVVSDANGDARVILFAAVNAATQPALIRATDLTTGNSVIAAFTIVQQINGSAILSVVPGDATITGPDKNTCSAGVRVDYFIYGGTPPYTIAPSFPDAVTMVNTTVFAAGGFFEIITNGACVAPLTFTIVDATGREITALLHNVLGTATPPGPPGPDFAVSPATGYPSQACAGKSFSFALTGGTPPFNVAIGVPAGPPTPPTVVTTPVTSTPGSFAVNFGAVVSPGVYKVFIGDTGTPMHEHDDATITCT